MIESTRPKLNPFKHAAVLLGALAFAASPSVGLPAVATAEPGTWDIERYDRCMDQARASYQRGEITLQDLTVYAKVCCQLYDGVWNAAKQDCQAPPGDSQGARQFPGNGHIPSDIATAPLVTQEPPRPIQVPSDIATATVLSQAPA